MIQKQRIKHLNTNPIKQDRAYVLYWMQASQRTEYNHALEYAILMANELKRPMIVYFGITDNYPEANRRHYFFMLEGLRDARESLKKRGIQMVIRRESPEIGAIELSKNACMVVADRGYLRIQKLWRSQVAVRCDCAVHQVESDVVVPIEVTSHKEEYAAATIRPKIMRNLSEYLVPVHENTPEQGSMNLPFNSFEIEPVDEAIARLDIDNSVDKAPGFHGGTSEAKRLLEDFLEKRLGDYTTNRNDPNRDALSHMSPYLHFGQISPLYIALKVLDVAPLEDNAYLEELIVRRELSMNFIYYNQAYDSYEGLPEWAKRSLERHSIDRREYVYARDELEAAKTHDPYWNAAQMEMVYTGKMHGYMRMYWGKKILEWSERPEDAFDTALYLNNRYELDGRDPNGYTGVAWCFGKHDRPWKEREIFGNIRYMNAAGLKRKFDPDAYVKRIDALKSPL